ncbi:hypothetical protein LguiA_004149 [Lonicera macranthoides]
MSPKHQLPTSFSIMEEAKRTRTREFVAKSAFSPSYFQKIVAEFLGTFVLIFAGCGVALVTRETTITIVGIASVWGLALMSAIYALGHISGAHFNPAVTIALAAACRFPLLHVPMYVLSQLVGSTLACLTLRVLFNDQDNIRPTLTQYSAATTDLEALAWEFIITFFLMLTICGAATDDRANKQLSGVAIGVTLVFNIIIAGPITGASMNPARSIGPAIVAGVYKNLWVFVVAPILGALAATMIYSILRSPKPQTYEEDMKNVYNDLYLENP